VGCGFFVLVAADRLDGLLSTIRKLPVLVEVVASVAFVPMDAEDGGVDELLAGAARCAAGRLLRRQLDDRVDPTTPARSAPPVLTTAEVVLRRTVLCPVARRRDLAEPASHAAYSPLRTNAENSSAMLT
jgi:hypothetical protein